MGYRLFRRPLILGLCFGGLGLWVCRSVCGMCVWLGLFECVCVCVCVFVCPYVFVWLRVRV